MLAVLAAIIAAIGPAGLANAQFMSHYSRGLSLSREDIDRLNAAAAKVVDEPAGATEAWSNPESGNSGTVRFIGTTQQDGMPCQTLEHVIKHKGVADRSTYTARRCQLPDGQWKLY